MYQNQDISTKIAANASNLISSLLIQVSNFQLQNEQLTAKVQELTIQNNALRKGSEKNESRGHSIAHQQNRNQNQQQSKKN